MAYKKTLIIPNQDYLRFWEPFRIGMNGAAGRFYADIETYIKKVFKQTTVRPVGLSIDATLNSQHNMKNRVTENPIELGRSVTDHVYSESRVFTMECLVSNDPGQIFTGGAIFELIDKFALGVTQSYTEAVYEYLKILFYAKAILKIETPLDTYESMVIESLSIPQNVDSIHAMRFEMTLKELMFVFSDIADSEVPKTIKQQQDAAKEKNKGKVNPETATPEQEEQLKSVFKKILG